eukprot:g661.t1
MGVVGVFMVSAFGWVALRQHFAQEPDKGQPNEEGNEEGSSFSVSPGLPLHLQFGQFGGGPDPKPDLVAVGATEKHLPEREAFQKELKEANANCKQVKKELKEAEAKVEKVKKERKEAEAKVEKAKKERKEAEAKVEKAKKEVEKAKKEVKEAEAKLEKAEATGTKDLIKRAKQMFGMAVKGANSAQAGVDSAQAGVDSAQAGVDSAQAGVDSAQAGVDSAQAGVKYAQAALDSAQARVNNAQVLVDECIQRQANMNRELAAGWTLDTADSVYQLFKDKGWVPEQLPAPLRLVTTSKFLPKLRHREDAIRLLCETVSQRFKNYLKGFLDKEKQPHLICFATAGTGKSRLAQETLSLLQKHVEHRELRALLRNSTVSVHVTFNGDTKFNQWDRESGAEAALSVRTLASYFGVQITSLHFLRTIELRTALDCILLDFRRRRSLAQDSPVAFYLAVDDVGQTLLPADNAKVARSFLKDISNAAGSWLLGPPRSVFPITLMTGTTAQAITSILATESSHPYVSLPVPLLSFNESDAMLRELGLEEWANDGQGQQLLADIGGLPRLLEILFSSLQTLVEMGQRPTNASWATVQHALMTFVKQRTGHVEEEVVHAIVRAALTRETVTNEDVAHGQQTWGDLESCGAVFLREQKQGGMVVEVPYLIIEGKVRNLRKRRLPDVVEALFRVPEPRFWEWQTWEKFNALFDGATAWLLAQREGKGSQTVSVARFYRGALVDPAIANWEFGLSPRVEFQTCEKRFPETSTRPSHQGKEFSWRAGEVSVMNADGAKADHFMAAPLVNSFEVLVRFGQEKWSRDVGARPRVARKRIIKEKSKILAAAERLGPGHRSMVAFFTNVDVPLAPVPFCAIVGVEQMRDFYSQTFAARAFLGGPSRRKGST